MYINHLPRVNHYRLKITLFKALLNHEVVENGISENAKSYEMAIVYFQSKIDTLLNRAIVYAPPS